MRHLFEKQLFLFFYVTVKLRSFSVFFFYTTQFKLHTFFFCKKTFSFQRLFTNYKHQAIHQNLYTYSKEQEKIFLPSDKKVLLSPPIMQVKQPIKNKVNCLADHDSILWGCWSKGAASIELKHSNLDEDLIQTCHQLLFPFNTHFSTLRFVVVVASRDGFGFG